MINIGGCCDQQVTVKLGVAYACVPVTRAGMRPVLAMLNDGSAMAFVLDETPDNRYSS